MSTALLLIDLINDLSHPEGRAPSCAAQLVARGGIAGANRALAIARGRGWAVVLVKVGFAAGYTDLPAASPVFGPAARAGALRLGQWGTDFHGDLQIQPDDPVLVKPRISPFFGTRLAADLRAQGIGRLVLAGVSTAWAIQAAARDAHDRDLQVVVVEDACAAASAAEHGHSITLLSRIATVTSAAGLAALA
ncbi:cysteine hydrolase [Cyanobium sp. Morenito 9A2]|uniref:cysteine hydrolase n=1 Tax=Cyanobium sp. Morenito 9A2 TaxID=2823718 RepID=UPI0020CB6A64|nr:cysteine hydrolase [Cyanobium sp. Morenito 9A2]MCP9848648.1 cysteine hydrolase [Cyanobium sp. Morenito 9A2]